VSGGAPSGSDVSDVKQLAKEQGYSIHDIVNIEADTW
jgi:hypothetical protein